MKRAVLLLAIVALVLSAMAVAGCEDKAHHRYRIMNYRRVIDADILGFADDHDAVWLQEHPTRLTPWYNR